VRAKEGLVPARAVVLVVLTLSLPPDAASAATAPVKERPAVGQSSPLQRVLDAALAHYRGRRFDDARAGFVEALALAPAGDERDNLEFNIAACDYELGHFRAAEARFARLGERGLAMGGEALLHAGWAALGVEDVGAAQRYLRASEAKGEPREALTRAIEELVQSREAAAFDDALRGATAAYERGDLAGAEAAIASARERESRAAARSRAALDYLTGLLARERGDDLAAQAALERSLSANPDDGAVRALLGELAQANGDTENAERHYRASLDADLSPAEADTVRAALDALYPVPPSGLFVWAALGAGYDSNATQSGSTDALGYTASGNHGSPFAAPFWAIEYRFRVGRHARLVPYYTGDWLLLTDADVEDTSLQSHEAGARWHLGLSPWAELRITLGGGLTLSGLEPSPFSMDGVLGGRLGLQHGASFQSALLLEVRPTLGLSERDYLSGSRSDIALRERFEYGRWGAAVQLGYRYNAIGTQVLDIAALQFPNCVQCIDARYVIPLGYAGPSVAAALDYQLTAGLQLGATAKYEHRTYLEASHIEGPALRGLLRAASEKIREDDRMTFGARARYRLDSAPDLGLYLDYALRVSRSNVAFGSGGPGNALDYDDRNFSQHVVELGLDVRR
jgi:tetratricopeptide (TPR) repeat protein